MVKPDQVKLGEIHFTTSPGLHELLTNYSDVFQEGLGSFKGYEVKINVNPDATPRFHKARTVCEKVEAKLDRLVAEGTLEPVEYSDWAAPIVAVVKSDPKSVRICGDFRVTVNQLSQLDRYPIPRIDDIFATLEGGKIFTKLDLSQAYQQLKLDAESQKYLLINTHKGLFRYTRLPLRISSAPGSFQRAMETLLQGIPHVTIYIDDILITGETEADHLQTVEKGKCKFLIPSVDYLGYVIDAQGLRPHPDKVSAIQQAPKPLNVTRLKSYLGLLSYYGKFLSNLSTLLNPLYKLLGKDVPWKWSSPQEQASPKLLVHFNPRLPLLLACDASAYAPRDCRLVDWLPAVLAG